MFAYLGGRLETTSFNGRDYELGALFLHSSNFYMKSFLESLSNNACYYSYIIKTHKIFLDLKKCGVPKKSEKYVGFYDSEGIKFSQEGDYTGIFGKLSTANYFGLDIVSFTKWAQSFIENFSK